MDVEVVLARVIHDASSNPIVSGLIILVAFALIQDFFLFRRLRKLVRGGDGASLEGTIRSLITRTELLESHAKKTEAALNNLDERMQRAIRGVSVQRFDPFQNSGGQQSFSSALLTEQGDGVVISGIHARDGVRVYAKEVSKFQSERELSDEEQTSIAEAKKRLQ